MPLFCFRPSQQGQPGVDPAQYRGSVPGPTKPQLPRPPDSRRTRDAARGRGSGTLRQ